MRHSTKKLPLTDHQRSYRRRLRQRLRRKKFPEKEAQYNKSASDRKRAWAEKNADTLSERGRSAYIDNREARLQKARQYREENADKIKESQKSFYEKNKQRILEKNKAWRKAQPKEVLNESIRSWKRKNKARVVEYNTSRTIPQRESLKLLNDSEISLMNNIYEYSRRISKCLGIAHHVDHIAPLVGDGFNGLHVPWNLKVIPASVNIAKSNNY